MCHCLLPMNADGDMNAESGRETLDNCDKLSSGFKYSRSSPCSNRCV